VACSQPRPSCVGSPVLAPDRAHSGGTSLLYRSLEAEQMQKDCRSHTLRLAVDALPAADTQLGHQLPTNATLRIIRRCRQAPASCCAARSRAAQAPGRPALTSRIETRTAICVVPPARTCDISSPVYQPRLSLTVPPTYSSRSHLPRPRRFEWNNRDFRRRSRIQ